MSPFSFLPLLIWALFLFFLISLVKGLSIYIFDEPAFSFSDLFYCFLYLYLIHFCTDIYHFFSSPNFDFFLNFKICRNLSLIRCQKWCQITGALPSKGHLVIASSLKDRTRRLFPDHPAPGQKRHLMIVMLRPEAVGPCGSGSLSPDSLYQTANSVNSTCG